MGRLFAGIQGSALEGLTSLTPEAVLRSRLDKERTRTRWRGKDGTVQVLGEGVCVSRLPWPGLDWLMMHRKTSLQIVWEVPGWCGDPERRALCTGADSRWGDRRRSDTGVLVRKRGAGRLDASEHRWTSSKLHLWMINWDNKFKSWNKSFKIDRHDEEEW